MADAERVREDERLTEKHDLYKNHPELRDLGREARAGKVAMKMMDIVKTDAAFQQQERHDFVLALNFLQRSDLDIRGKKLEGPLTGANGLPTTDFGKLLHLAQLCDFELLKRVAKNEDPDDQAVDIIVNFPGAVFLAQVLIYFKELLDAHDRDDTDVRVSLEENVLWARQEIGVTLAADIEYDLDGEDDTSEQPEEGTLRTFGDVVQGIKRIIGA
jgi:hypothetical protein